uniref:Uncharacterized protein n=1 Tax=Heliothis virescens TaxID=7102 RepID=A0A2A4J8G7_HELVI
MLTSSEEVQEAVRRWVIALARTSHKLGGYCCIAPGSRDPEPPQHPHLGTLATRGAVANREPEGEDGDSGGHQKGSACGHRPGADRRPDLRHKENREREPSPAPLQRSRRRRTTSLRTTEPAARQPLVALTGVDSTMNWTSYCAN